MIFFRHADHSFLLPLMIAAPLGRPALLLGEIANMG